MIPLVSGELLIWKMWHKCLSTKNCQWYIFFLYEWAWNITAQIYFDDLSPITFQNMCMAAFFSLFTFLSYLWSSLLFDMLFFFHWFNCWHSRCQLWWRLPFLTFAHKNVIQLLILMSGMYTSSNRTNKFQITAKCVRFIHSFKCYFFKLSYYDVDLWHKF